MFHEPLKIAHCDLAFSLTARTQNRSDAKMAAKVCTASSITWTTLSFGGYLQNDSQKFPTTKNTDHYRTGIHVALSWLLSRHSVLLPLRNLSEMTGLCSLLGGVRARWFWSRGKGLNADWLSGPAFKKHSVNPLPCHFSGKRPYDYRKSLFWGDTAEWNFRT